MSGFEIAGVVLGTLPLLVNSAVSVKNGLVKTKSWWRFETTFATFIARLRKEEIAYRQVIKRLLGPTGIPDNQLKRLLEGAETSLWNETKTCEALETRLDVEERSWFHEQLEEMCDIIQMLHDLLPQEHVSALLISRGIVLIRK